MPFSGMARKKQTFMAYIFQEHELPKLVSVIPGRERTFLVDMGLAKSDAMSAVIMRYEKGASSPYHFHKNCEHFYFILEGYGTVESEDAARDVGPGDLIFISAEAKHRMRASKTSLTFFEFQAPNRFPTTTIDGSPDDLRWIRIEGKVVTGI
jgi:mannose-6-phosphate isomerase-like protein (cupin superfamily)